MSIGIRVSGIFEFSVSPYSVEVICNLSAIKMSAYNVQDMPALFAFQRSETGKVEQIDAYATITVYNASGDILVEHNPANRVSSYSYVIPHDGLSNAAGVVVRIYADVERKELLAESRKIAIVRENPIPFPRGEVWSVEMVLKNGEMLLLDNVAYMWSSPVSGNSVIHPKTDIANNPLTTRWTAYQNWPLLCTNMLIARLGLIGKAVFYDEYMFSQYGRDVSGNPSTNYNGFADGSFIPSILFNFLNGSGHLANKGFYWDESGCIYQTTRPRIVWRIIGIEMDIAGIPRNTTAPYNIKLDRGTYLETLSNYDERRYINLPDPQSVPDAILDIRCTMGTRSSGSISLRCSSSFFFRYENGVEKRYSEIGMPFGKQGVIEASDYGWRIDDVFIGFS